MGGVRGALQPVNKDKQEVLYIKYTTHTQEGQVVHHNTQHILYSRKFSWENIFANFMDRL